MEDWEGLLSNCCGAEIKWHDICSDCGEHCEPECDCGTCGVCRDRKREEAGEYWMECERNDEL